MALKLGGEARCHGEVLVPASGNCRADPPIAQERVISQVRFLTRRDADATTKTDAGYKKPGRFEARCHGVASHSFILTHDSCLLHGTRTQSAA